MRTTIFETESSGHTSRDPSRDYGTIRRLSMMLFVDEKPRPSALEIVITRPPSVGRLYHHLAIQARPNAMQQLFYYRKGA